MTSEERRIRARLGALTLHSKYDSRQLTASARQAFLDRFEREVDPQGILPEAERTRRATHARAAYFTRLSLLSAQARRKKKAAE